MKPLALKIVAVMITILAVIAPPTSAATSSGPYYATPAWDQQLDCSSIASCPRFIVLSNWIDADHPSGGAAVLDRETGLVWDQSPSTTARPWLSALSHCVAKTVGNRRGWRLPTVQELASLVDQNQSQPSLPAGHPFSNVQFSSPPPSKYWSASSRPGGTAAYTVNFVAGGTDFPPTTDSNFAWCVRGGQGVDPQ
jgi:uncharacterized protein DUF1566